MARKKYGIMIDANYRNVPINQHHPYCQYRKKVLDKKNITWCCFCDDYVAYDEWREKNDN